MIKKISPWLIAAVFIIFFCLSFIPIYLLRPNLTSTGDDQSYVSHAFTIGLDFDLDYSNEMSSLVSSFKAAQSSMPSHPIGSGIVAAPFVALFGIIDRIQGNPVIHDRTAYLHSWSFFGFLFASSTAILAGAGLYLNTIRKLLKKPHVPVLLLSIVSSGIVYYGLGRYTMSHSFEFFSAALLTHFSVYYAAAKDENKNKFILLLGISFSLLLCILIRYNNIHLILLPFIISILTKTQMHKPPVTRRMITELALSCLVALGVFMLISYILYNELFPTFWNLYSLSHIDQQGFYERAILKAIRLIPNIFPLIFGPEFGLIWSFPALIFGSIEMFRYAFTKINPKKGARDRIIFIALLFIYIAFPTAIVLYWETTASSYGFRYLFSLMPIAVIGGLFFWQRTTARIINGKLKKILNTSIRTAFCILLITGTLSFLFFLVTPGLKLRPQTNVFGKHHNYSANHYLTELGKAVIKPKNWVLMAGKGALGLPFAYLAAENEKMAQFIPALYRNKFLPYYTGIPIRIFIQVFVLICTWGTVGFVIGKIPVKKGVAEHETNNTDSLL